MQTKDFGCILRNPPIEGPIPLSAKEIFPFSHYIDLLPQFELAFGGQEVLMESTIEWEDGTSSELFISLVPDFMGDKVVGVFTRPMKLNNYKNRFWRNRISKSQIGCMNSSVR
jgi:hypothetical protein